MKTKDEDKDIKRRDIKEVDEYIDIVEKLVKRFWRGNIATIINVIILAVSAVIITILGINLSVLKFATICFFIAFALIAIYIIVFELPLNYKAAKKLSEIGIKGNEELLDKRITEKQRYINCQEEK